MAESKYGKYILKGKASKTSRSGAPAVATVMEGLKDWGGIQHRMTWQHITAPTVIEEKPHSHDFDEFLCFLSCDPSNAYNFGAEVEISMGKEEEKQTIDAATIVCIPKGLAHGSINFKKIGRPILFCNVYLAPEYVKKTA